jgi:hypothetical protein
MRGAGWWGFFTMVMMSRANTNTWLDSTVYTKNPARTFTFFMFGAFVAVWTNIEQIQESSLNGDNYQLEYRISQNEHTHAILKNINQQLQTRKMGIWDAGPQ